MSSISLTKKYPLNAIAKAFGVDRNTLVRRLTDAQIYRGVGGITIREAFLAWTKREANEDARRRKNVAEADLAELMLKERKGEIEGYFGLNLQDMAIQVRSIISGVDYIPQQSRHRLGKEIAEYVHFRNLPFGSIGGSKKNEKAKPKKQ